MFKIEGDYQNIQVSTMSDYTNSNSGVAGVKFNITLSAELLNHINETKTMLKEWKAQKDFVNSHPAVKNAWEQYLVVCELSKKDKIE